MPELDVIEVSLNPCDQANLDEAVPAAKRQRVGVLAKRALANAAWRPAARQRGMYRSYSEPYRLRLEAMDLDAVRRRHDLPWDEFALRFTLSLPGVQVALVGTTRPANMARNLDLAAKGPLPETCVAEVRRAFSTVASLEDWPGLT